MNQTDWIDYFEAIHSRTPNEAEIAQALAAGEFSEAEVAESEAAESDIVERNAGTAPLESVDTAGTVSLGETVAPLTTDAEKSTETTTETATEMSTKIAAFKAKKKEVIEKLKENQMIMDTAQVATHYLSWVLETVKRPMTKASGFISLYTYLTLGLIVIFSALTATLNLHAFYEKTVVNTTFSDFSSFVGISPTNPIGFGTFVALLFVVALFMVTVVFATWVGLKVLKSPLTFSNVVDHYTRLLVPSAVLIVMASILSLIRLNLLSYIVFILAFSIVSMALYYLILTAEHHLKLDDFYARLLALITSGAIMFVITFILVLIFTTIIFKSAFTW